MRLLTFEEREDLCRRADCDLLLFVEKLQFIGARYGTSHQKLLAKLLRRPKETDLTESRLLTIRRVLAEEGREMTPDEVVATVEKLCCKIRNELRERGWTEDRIPESDTVLMDMMREVVC